MKVSVICITYNHADYIRKALDGIVMQKTNFDFELVVNDDGSTDGTTEIIKEYEKKYPHLVKGVYHDENQFSKGVPFSEIMNLKVLGGKYIAICEGDDYWTDENKLQIQVDFMENHPTYTCCFHSSMRKNAETMEDIRLFPSKRERFNKKSFTLKDVRKGYFIETCSVMYRFDMYKDELISLIPPRIINLDAFLIGYFLSYGRAGYIDRVMSVKLINETGVWNNPSQTVDERNVRFYYEIVNFAVEYGKMLRYLGKEKYNSFSICEYFDDVIFSAVKLKRDDIITELTNKFYKEYYDENTMVHKKYKKIKKRYFRWHIFYLSLLFVFILVFIVTFFGNIL